MTSAPLNRSGRAASAPLNRATARLLPPSHRALASEAFARVRVVGDFPLKRSYAQRDVAHAAGIFQFGTKRLQDNIEVISMYRVLASVTGAALSDREFDVETWINQRFREAGCPEDDTVTTSGSEIVRDLYSHKSGTRRRQVLEALDRLVEATVTLPGLDPATGEVDATKVERAHLIERIVTDADLKRWKQAQERGEAITFASVARLKGNPTLTIQLPRWKAAALRAGHGKTLDRDVQRELGGGAKRVWVQLEAQAYVQLGDAPDHEVLSLELDDDTYAAFGINHERPRDRRRYLIQVLERIEQVDPTYVELDIAQLSETSASYGLHVLRCTGETRQRRLRERARERLQPRQRPRARRREEAQLELAMAPTTSGGVGPV